MSNYRTDELERFSSAFKALSNPHRLEIFNILSNCCAPAAESASDTELSCCVGDLVPKLDVAASTLSHHLKELNRAGLIDMQRDGKQIYCSLNTAMLKELRMLLKFYELNLKRAERYTQQQDPI